MRYSLALVLLLIAGRPASAAESVTTTALPPSATGPVDFVKHVRPLFEAKCTSCHGAEKQRSGFRLDVKKAALAGGDHGVAILPGKSAESPLVRYVARLVPDMEMPPRGEPLTAEEISLLRAWIDAGAIWPDGIDRDADADRNNHWAFQPVTRPDIPEVKTADWVRNELDAFILARLEREGLAPSPEADRRTLLRRLTFDLTGLPPTPEEMRAFLNDPDPEAYERCVDRLLASPRYGERWARHWLDVVHFGESHGYDKDKPRMNAWPYRDYVIRSLNADKPYSRFVQEQIAGDILFPGEPDGVVALGFLSAGPWDFVGHVELPESKTDGLIARYNDRDDMIATTMSSLMSLTVHCARCHDHKFDPIPQRDYYGLQAVFAGVDRADRPFDTDRAVHRERQKLLGERRTMRGALRELEVLLSKVETDELSQFDERLRGKRKALEELGPGKESPANGYHSAIEATPDVEKWVQVDLAGMHEIREIRLIPARPIDFRDSPGFGFPVRYRVEVTADPAGERWQVLADHTAKDVPNPGNNPVVLEGGGVRARYVRMTALKLWERENDFVFALAEMQVFSGTNNIARSASVQALDSIEGGRWGKSRLVDGFDSRGVLDRQPESTALLEQRSRLKKEIEALTQVREEVGLRGLEPAQREAILDLRGKLGDLERRLREFPKPEMVYAAASEFPSQGSFHPANTPRAVHLLRRGDVKAKGELMTPAALSCFPWLPADLPFETTGAEAERRRALALWLTDSRNGLLRRSIVNRVWHYHFGRGLVETPNDFGRMGAMPSHPELLDWLANWFVAHGESLKAVHHLVLTSATYRQSAGSNPGAEGLDADNRLLWRMNRSRLDAESLRDALLAVSGTLDLTMGGPSVQQFWFKDDHSPTYDYTRFDPDTEAGRRRSIYRFIVRSVPDPFMDTLDCPDPSVLTPKRNQTLTALQALALLNNPFVLRQAEHFANRLTQESAGEGDPILRAYQIALGREPSGSEHSRLKDFASRHGLASACRVLFNSNEFSFID